MLKLSIFSILMLSIEAFYFNQANVIGPVEQAQLEAMRMKIARMPAENFYNYHVMCSGGGIPRVNLPARLVHKTVPSRYFDTILNTIHGSYNRINQCPKWTRQNTEEKGMPESGAMEHLALDEQTPVGQVVYLLSAADPERRPLYYFMRKAENEPETSDNLFEVTQIKIGYDW